MVADLLPCSARVAGMSGLREKGWGKGNLKDRLFEVAKAHTPRRAENTGVQITPGVTFFLNIFQTFRKLRLSCILLHKFAPKFWVFCFQSLCKNHLRFLHGAGGSGIYFQFIAGQ